MCIILVGCLIIWPKEVEVKYERPQDGPLWNPTGQGHLLEQTATNGDKEPFVMKIKKLLSCW